MRAKRCLKPLWWPTWMICCLLAACWARFLLMLSAVSWVLDRSSFMTALGVGSAYDVQVMAPFFEHAGIPLQSPGDSPRETQEVRSFQPLERTRGQKVESPASKFAMVGSTITLRCGLWSINTSGWASTHHSYSFVRQRPGSRAQIYSPVRLDRQTNQLSHWRNSGGVRCIFGQREAQRLWSGWTHHQGLLPSQGCYFALLGDTKLVAGRQVISTYLIAGHTGFPESAESHMQPKPWHQKKLLTLANCVKALWQQSSALTCWVEKRRPQWMLYRWQWRLMPRMSMTRATQTRQVMEAKSL